MTVSSDYKIRRAGQSDEPFLWEMLYQSLYVPEGVEPFPRDVLSRPEVARYVKGWGREHDIGFLAVDSNTNQSIGAVWMRLFPEGDRGFAYVDDETPELGVAVLPEHRGNGVGTELLRHLIEASKGLYPSIALSVSPENPATHLYRRMGFETVDAQESALVMKRKLNDDGAA
ncbi:MAG TPA: GNAT family N-acetyltransferase [Pyrinomonadaceae bacterium]|nr:GNAT family N-acetyltransferase [Pyrinomonadaceae bacterium]